MISACFFNLLANLILVVLMLRTASRTEQFKRPYIEQAQDSKDFSLSFKQVPVNRPSHMEKTQLKIKFLEKSRDDGGQIYFTFISELNFLGRENPKVVKAL